MTEIQNKELHRITSTAIVHKDGKYLLLQRSPNKKAFPGKWTVPGGGLEVSDYINLPKTTSDHWYFAIENSLRREIKEETGLEVGELKYLCSMTFIRPDGIPTVILSFYCDWKSGLVKLDEDNINYAWTAVEEAKNYDLVEGLLEEIKMVDRRYHPPSAEIRGK
ncbi:NUDIX domain-containing protein [Patescibacteria group bacterium]|nr:NUDIX domain-containing protein [Patescibacteria group bacterium]